MPTLNEMLQTLSQTLRNKGAGEGEQVLARLVSELSVKAPGMVKNENQLLMRAIDLSKQSDPVGAIALIEWAEQRGISNSKMDALLATCQDRLGEHADAKKTTQKIVADTEADPEAVLVAANLLVRYNEQESALKSALAAYEQLGRPLNHTATLLYITQRCAAFKESDALTRQITEAYQAGNLSTVNESPRTNLLWSSDEKMNIAVTREWAERSLPKDGKNFAGARPPLAGRRLKIGYLSSDFREHPTLRLMMGALRHHDATKYEVILICSGWDDKSPIRREAEQMVSKILSVADKNDADAAELIRREGIDVLVELNGPTRANRMSILSFRPAPVQIDYLGWAGSVGGVGVDYVIGDSWTIPPGAEQSYPESVLRMDPTYQINDHRSYTAVEPLSRKSLGLPTDGIVFGVYNAINKIQGDVWSVWMDILKAVPNSVISILDPGDAARKRLGRAALAAGVDVKRVIGARPMTNAQHLNRIAAVDLMLDPWPYGGHTSTADALYAGVPVLTINGRNFPGRVSAGLLRAAGLPSLVARDPNDYVAKALHLAKNPERLRQLRETLKGVRETSCYDAASRTAQLETLFRATFQRWERGEAPANLSVKYPRPPQAELLRPVPLTVLRADEGYGSQPSWIRENTPFTPVDGTMQNSPVSQADNTAARMRPHKRSVILVSGSWSSGTSATAQVVAALGAANPGPMFKTSDPRTETNEMAAFRELLLSMASEATVSRHVSKQAALAAFRQFDADHFSGITVPIMLKHPLSALFIEELNEVFDIKILAVMRDFAAIERTRARRQWAAQYGEQGAQKIYLNLMNAAALVDAPSKWFRYSDLTSNPIKQVTEIADFIDVDSSPKQLAAAVAVVRKD